MSTGVFTVLFLCTGHAARRSMAEAILHPMASDRFYASSAGSPPQGKVHPYALDVLRHFQYPTHGLRSKSWEALTGREAPPIDDVIALGDDAAYEPCLFWPGHPVTCHWGLSNPAAVKGDAEATRLAFVETLQRLQQRLAPWTQWPDAAVDWLIQQQQCPDLDERVGAPDNCERVPSAP